MSRDRVTTALDLASFLLLAVGIGMALWIVWPPAGPIAAALVLLAASWLIDRRADVTTTEKEGGTS